jgi:hypothetical protein
LEEWRRVGVGEEEDAVMSAARIVGINTVLTGTLGTLGVDADDVLVVADALLIKLLEAAPAAAFIAVLIVLVVIGSPIGTDEKQGD